MATYPGDVYVFTISITKSDGSTPSVTSAPQITILNLSNNSTVVVAAAMTLISGTTKIYTYKWTTTGLNNGTYLGVVSYAADGNTFTGQYLDKVFLGDTNIAGRVALDATVAKDSTVAKASTTLQTSQYITPDNSSAVQAIKSKTDQLPIDPVSISSLSSLISMITDIHNVSIGRWAIDKINNTLTLFTTTGSVLKIFDLTNTDTLSQRSPQ